MIDVASELRYDPNEDDAHPGRSPSAVLRLLLSAVEATEGARSPVDVYESVCRALAEHGIVAVVLAPRHAGGSRYSPVAHRLSVESLPRSVPLPALDGALEGPLAFPAGGHPLAQVLGPVGTLAFPSIAVAVRGRRGALLVNLSLFAPDLGPEHFAAAEAFAALLSAAINRVEADRRLHELSARLEQRVRDRTRELGALHDLSLALCAVATDQEAARIAVTTAATMFACDVASGVLCVDGRHSGAISARAALSDSLCDLVAARLTESLRALSGWAHADCVPSAFQVAALPSARRSSLAYDGSPEGVIEAPVIVGERVVGLLALANLSRVPYSPDEVRLLYTVASQLAAAVERLSGTGTTEHRRLMALLDGVPDGVLLLDGGGRELAGNRLGRAQLAKLRDAAGEVLPADLRDLITRALGSDGPIAVELATGTAEPHHLLATAARVLDVTGQPAVALSLRDITDETTLRDRLIQSEKMASLGQLVCGVAHELNNPLTAILGFAQLLLARPLEPAPRREAETIAGEAERAAKIVQNLLSFARRRRSEKVPVDMNSLIDRVLKLQEYELAVHDIEVRRELAPDLPRCLADPNAIQQVLLNLITNARQAIAAGPRRGTICVGTKASGQFVRITVHDDGPGIAPEHLRRVFDPFFTTKPVGEGTGLGLTISYGIVEDHKGHISVESRRGQGTTFTIDLPITTARWNHDENAAPEAPRFDRARAILVIDDEPAIQELLSEILVLDGHRVDCAGSAAEALERLEGSTYDAIIADVRMPRMDGMEFYRRVRARYPALARRIIFTSGDTVSPDTEQFIEAHGIPFLPKPFELRDVRTFVAAVLVREGS